MLLYVRFTLSFIEHILVLFASCTGSSVRQTPTDIFSKNSTKTAKITCSHSVDNYNQILWYKQSTKELQFLGYHYFNQGYPESGVDVEIDGGSNKNQICTLTIKGRSSSAVYFCAAS